MMKRSLSGFVVSVGVVVIGCQAEPAEHARFVAVEQANELGITQLVIDRSSPAGEPVLEIRGLDPAGQEVAVATLRTGAVIYDDQPAYGTDLTLSVGDMRYQHVTPDLERHTTPVPPHGSIASFIRLAGVASEIDREAGIRFTERATADGEVAYEDGQTTAHPALALMYATTSGTVGHACMEVSNAAGTIQKSKHVIKGGPNTDHVLFRSYGNLCVNAALEPNCGAGNPCTWGPCGSRNDGTSYTGEAGKVFKLSGSGEQPETVCAWDSGTAYNPVPYTNQTLYADIAGGSCTCTSCSDGVPQPLGCNRMTTFAYP